MDWGVFKRAVADSEEPTQGYVYREMAQWTFKDYNTQMKFIEALMKKLKPSSSAHVLFKVLRIIKVMCETGHSDFQKEMQKNTRTEEVKVFVSYRGVPDIRHGDALSEKVRQAAREALEVIFSHRKEETLKIEAGYGNSMAGTNGSDTLKSSFTTGHSVTGSLVEGPMMPYSSNIAPMPARNKWAEHVAQQVSKAYTSTASRMLSAITEKAKNLYPDNGSMGYKSPKDMLYENAMRLATTSGVSSAMYGDAFASPSYSSSSFPVGFQQAEVATSTSPQFVEASASDNGSGWKFIDSIGPSVPVTLPVSNTQPQQLTLFQAIAQRISQMKTTPQRVELHTFLTQCRETGAASKCPNSSSYSAPSETETEIWDELAEALDAHLGQCHPWQQRLNVLVAIEALLTVRETGDAAMRDGVTQYFRENPEDIQRNVLVVQSTLRERARRVLRLLGLPECSDKSMDTPAQASSSVQQVQNARNGTNAFVSTVPIQPEQQQQQQSGVDFCGMSLRTDRRVSREPHKLKKRAPMRFAEEEQQREEKEGDIGMGFTTHSNSRSPPALLSTSGNSNGNVSTTHSNGTHNDKNVLDDLFPSSSVTPESHFHPLSSVTPAGDSTHRITTDGATVPKESVASDHMATSFDFLSISNGPNTTRNPPVAPVAPFLQERQQEHGVANRNSLRESADIFSLTPDPPSSESLSPIALMQMQQQMEVLMNSLQQNPKPIAITQLQQLMLQQQQLMALVAQQQAEEGGAAGSNEMSSHQHFTTGATSHGNGANGANAFAEVQKEMMSRMRGGQKQGE